MINGSYLRKLRKSHNYTLIEFSQEIGCTASFLSQLERGQKEPSLTTLRKLSEVLGVPIASFFLPEEETAPLTYSSAYILTRKENRPTMPCTVPGVRCEILTPNPSTDRFLPISAMHFFLPPHATYLEEATMRSNDAGICPMVGELYAVFENEEVLLQPGDCLYIHTGVVHNLINRSDTPCEFFIFSN